MGSSRTAVQRVSEHTDSSCLVTAVQAAKSSLHPGILSCLALPCNFQWNNPFKISDYVKMVYSSWRWQTHCTQMAVTQGRQYQWNQPSTLKPQLHTGHVSDLNYAFDYFAYCFQCALIKALKRYEYCPAANLAFLSLRFACCCPPCMLQCKHTSLSVL